MRILLSEQVEAFIHDSSTYPGAKVDVWMPTITTYEPEKSHASQLHHDEEVWWYFLYGDRPPLPNPTIIDRPGIEARMIPWLAWAERVDGLLEENGTVLDETTLAREVALFADRCDITEEITRLGAHLKEFDTYLKANREVGRTLDFLTQEMLRETNTIGSKSADGDLARDVIALKSDIDRLKEQAANLE